jgi:iron(III) transport system permease protein
MTTSLKAFVLGILALGILFLVAPLASIVIRLIAIPRGSLSFIELIIITCSSTAGLLLHSLALAGCVGFVTTLCSAPLVYLLVGPKTILQSIIRKVLIIPLLLPPFVGTLGIRQLLSRFGTANLLLMDYGITDSPIDWLGANGTLGIVIIQSLHFLPLMTLFLAAGAAQIDMSLLEAAWCSGSSRVRIFISIIAPLLVPTFLGAALLVVMGSIADIGTPLLFDHRDVVAVKIFDSLTGEAEDPVGYVLSIVLGFIGLLLFPLFALGALKSFSDGRTNQPLRIKKLPLIAHIPICMFSLVLIATSLIPHFGVIMIALAQEWVMTPFPKSLTTRHLQEVFNHPLAYSSIMVSLSLSILSALLVLIVGFIISWTTERFSTVLTRVLALGSYLPLTIPGLVFAFSYLVFFSGTFLDPNINPLPLLVIAYAVRKLPFMVRACSSGLKLVPKALEESAFVVGASKWRVFFSISSPLIRSHLIAGFVLCFCSSMLEVSDSLMLAREERFYPVSKALYTLASRPDGPTLSCALALHVMTLIAGLFGITAIASRRSQNIKEGGVV